MRVAPSACAFVCLFGRRLLCDLLPGVCVCVGLRAYVCVCVSVCVRVTVAILAQGTSWAVAVTQALFQALRITDHTVLTDSKVNECV